MPRYAIATVSGTSALHTALRVADVQADDLVITQPLTFVATGNAIRYQHADPLFVDIDEQTLGLSPAKLADFLVREAIADDQGQCRHRTSQRRIAACVPMHTFGHPAAINQIAKLCRQYRIPLVEDAAEALGSHHRSQHVGTFGLAGIISFNGNKIVTSGGGGIIVTNHADVAARARHLTTQAKLDHPWEYTHDAVGYNYRMPNINAALACAQLENLPALLTGKRTIAEAYAKFAQAHDIEFVREPKNAVANYWLNSLRFADRDERDQFLSYTNERGIMTRPAWTLLHRLPMFRDSYADDLSSAEAVADRLVNVPSSVPE